MSRHRATSHVRAGMRPAPQKVTEPLRGTVGAVLTSEQGRLRSLTRKENHRSRAACHMMPRHTACCDKSTQGVRRRMRGGGRKVGAVLGWGGRGRLPARWGGPRGQRNPVCTGRGGPSPGCVRHRGEQWWEGWGRLPTRAGGVPGTRRENPAGCPGRQSQPWKGPCVVGCGVRLPPLGTLGSVCSRGVTR